MIIFSFVFFIFEKHKQENVTLSKRKKCRIKSSILCDSLNFFLYFLFYSKNIEILKNVNSVYYFMKAKKNIK